MTRFFALFSILTAMTLLFTSCARTVSVAETLSIPEHTEIFTAYNLWYDDPANMTTLNTQKGTIIPFGTQIEIIEATDKKIKFRTTSDELEFTIKYDPQYRLQTVEEYIKDVFTISSSSDLAENLSPLAYEKIKRGIVEKGMTKNEVRLAYGPPCAFRTSSPEAKTWVYWTDFLVGKHVIFNKDKVLDIIELK